MKHRLRRRGPDGDIILDIDRGPGPVGEMQSRGWRRGHYGGVMVAHAVGSAAVGLAVSQSQALKGITRLGMRK